MNNVVEEHNLSLALSKHFGFSSFKGNQEQIIQSVLNGNDTLVIMPTGGGKSLCYQLPAIMSEGTALIISPLIALMKNQVDLVRGYSQDDNIAHFLNSSLNRSQVKEVKSDLIKGHTKMLYVAPETLTKDETVEFLSQLKISFVAVDEAHCISEWGHDFRPEYRRIREIVENLGQTMPIMALTATATPKVRTDICRSLRLEDPYVSISSFNRANLYYEVRPKIKKDDVTKEIVHFIKQHENKSGIIYCLNRKMTEELAEMLTANGIKAGAYHAGLDSSTRSTRQDQFLSEELHVIVATIAFGMGIDKPDVRFVMHYNMPKSLENYYQETGRAGRDGQEGICIAFFSYADMNKLEKFMRDKSVAERDIGGQQLSEVVTYAESGGCRRRFLLHYFGESYDPKLCDKGCDNCRNAVEKRHIGKEVVQLLKAVKSLDENFNSKYLVNFLRGESNQEVVDFKHDQLPEFSVGKMHDIHFWNAVITQALLYGLLKKDIERYGLLKLPEKGLAYINDPFDIAVAPNHDLSKASIALDIVSQKTGALDIQLISMLKELRKKVAKSKSVPPYVVFQDRSLEEMATYYPISKKELEQITGVSRGKVMKYGRAFIELIAGYVEDEGIERPADLVVKSVASKSKDKIYIIQNIDRKIPLETIGKHLNLSMEELIKEIEKIVDSGTKLNIDYYINDFLDEYQQEEVFDYFLEAESDDITEAVKSLEEDDFTEDDVRMMRIKFMSEMAH